jgi:hypothetical protein
VWNDSPSSSSRDATRRGYEGNDTCGAAARLHDVDGGGAAHTPLMGFPSAAYLLTDVFFITPFFPSHPNVLDPKVSSVS